MATSKISVSNQAIIPSAGERMFYHNGTTDYEDAAAAVSDTGDDLESGYPVAIVWNDGADPRDVIEALQRAKELIIQRGVGF